MFFIKFFYHQIVHIYIIAKLLGYMEAIPSDGMSKIPGVGVMDGMEQPSDNLPKTPAARTMTSMKPSNETPSGETANGETLSKDSPLRRDSTKIKVLV
jgi:hypothetical protein